MTILISVSAEAIDRIVGKTYRSDVVPEVDGRLGRSDLLHLCYSARLTSQPRLEVTRPGALSVSVPLEGLVSIPWGVGIKFRMMAAADMAPEIEGDKLRVEMGELTFYELSLANGCSLPCEVLKLLGPFVRGLIFRGLMGPGGGPLIDLPVIQIPLAMMMPNAEPIEIRINDIAVEPPGVIVDAGIPGDVLTPAPLPAQEGWDVAMSISENNAELMAEHIVRLMGDIKGDFSFRVPDARAMADVLVASAETLTTLGRQGLGRRALRNASTIRVEYTARPGRPNLCFREGKIAICNTPAHVAARAVLEMERSRDSILQRLRAFFFPSLGKQGKTEVVTIGSWDIDEDVVLERADVALEQGPDGLPKMKITTLDLELDLGWPLPNEVLEKIVEGIGKGMIGSLLPETFPTEIPLPQEMPFKVKLEGFQVSTVEGILIVRGNADLVPVGDPEEVKRALKERIREVAPGSQMTACNELTAK